MEYWKNGLVFKYSEGEEQHSNISSFHHSGIPIIQVAFHSIIPIYCLFSRPALLWLLFLIFRYCFLNCRSVESLKVFRWNMFVFFLHAGRIRRAV